MSLFDILTNPLSLNINPLIEWIVMLIVGEIAFRIAYAKVGDISFEFGIHNSGIKSILHWTIRFGIYAIIWLIMRIITDGYNLIHSFFS